MTTYIGWMAFEGVAPALTEGEEMPPSMTLHRIARVTMTDERGIAVPRSDPAEAPGSSPERPLYVAQPDGDMMHAKLDRAVEIITPPGGLPVNVGTLPAPIVNVAAPSAAPVAPVTRPGESYDVPAIVEQQDGDKMHVKVDGGRIKPDLSEFANNRLPVDVLFPPPAPAVPTVLPFIPPAFPDSVELRGDALVWLEAISDYVASINKALRSMGQPDARSYTWSFTSAQTNQVLVAGTPGVSWVVLLAKASTDADTSVNVACRIGFSATGSLATLTANSLTPVMGEIISEPDLAPGSGVVMVASQIARGNPGDSILITCDAATSGSLRPVLVMYSVTG